MDASLKILMIPIPYSHFYSGGPPPNNGRPETFRRPAQNQRPPQQFNSRPQPRPQPQPQPQQVRVAQPQTQPQTINLSGDFAAPAASSSSSAFNCPLKTPNYSWQGQQFIVTFFDKSDGCNKFTGQEADNFCKSVGGRAVSLDSNEKALAMMDLLRQRAQRYMWTGGRIDHNAGVVTWPSGAREGYVEGQRFWSHTGGYVKQHWNPNWRKVPNSPFFHFRAKPVALPQPDNRDGNEICIGVLNNFYADGIKWHDVACHHKKPTICEL